MHHLRTAAACALFLSAISAAALAQPAAPAPGAAATPGRQRPPPSPTPMSLTSTAYTDGAVVPDKYTNSVPHPVSPALAWEHVPDGTVSFALIMHDPDTTNNMATMDLLHWMMFNIPATVRSLPEDLPKLGQLPDGTMQANTRGNGIGYIGLGGRGDFYHDYTIELYALNTTLSLPQTASRAEVLAAMEGHVIAKGVLVGRYHAPARPAAAPAPTP